MMVYEVWMTAVDENGSTLFRLPTGDWRMGETMRDGRDVVRIELPLGYWDCDRYLDYDPAARQCALSDGDWRSDVDTHDVLQGLLDESLRNMAKAKVEREKQAALQAGISADVSIAPKPQQPPPKSPEAERIIPAKARQKQVWPFVLLGCAGGVFVTISIILLLGFLVS